jgi:hypothetical protein
MSDASGDFRSDPVLGCSGRERSSQRRRRSQRMRLTHDD